MVLLIQGRLVIIVRKILDENVLRIVEMVLLRKARSVIMDKLMEKMENVLLSVKQLLVPENLEVELA